MSKLGDFFRWVRDRKLLKLVFYEEGRKNGFGMTLFIVASLFLREKLIDSGIWFGCVSVSLALIGGGNLADKYLEKKTGGDPKAAA